MAGLLTDYFKSLMGQVPSTSSFGQLGDTLSPEEQQLALQRMYQQRDQLQIRTIDPGKSWGGLDKMAVDPEDVKAARLYQSLWSDKI